MTAEIGLLKAWGWHFLVPVVVICFAEHLLIIFWHPRNRGPEEKSVYLDADTRIQIVDTMMMLPHAEKEQNAAFIVSWDIIITCPILVNECP